MTTEQGPSNPIPANPTYEPLEMIDRRFLSQDRVRLTVTSSGGKGFNITDVEGTPIFQVKSKSPSLHGRRFLTDLATGNTLVSSKGKLVTMHDKMEVFRGESQDEENLLFTSRKSKMFQSNLDIYLAKNTVEEAPDFIIKGSRKEGSFTIHRGNAESNTLIANVQRNSASNFSVTAYPNVDYAFIVVLAVLVSLHEKAGPLSTAAKAVGKVAMGIIGTVFAEQISTEIVENFTDDKDEDGDDT